MFGKKEATKAPEVLQLMTEKERELWIDMVKLSVSSGGTVMSGKYQADNLIKELRMRSKNI